MAKKSMVTENRMATRICEREDNHYYKHKMIREILHMYADEIYKALLKGERIQITGVGSIIPDIKVHDGNYNMPTCNKTEGNPPPYGKIRMSDNWGVRNAINKKLFQNIENGIYGLEKLPFTKKNFEFLKETGYIPEDEELPDEDDYEEE